MARLVFPVARRLFVAGVVLGSFLACVGEDAGPEAPAVDAGPTTSGQEAGRPIPQGAEGGECFPNKTCLDDLACRSNRCVDLGTSEADLDAGHDADADADAGPADARLDAVADVFVKDTGGSVVDGGDGHLDGGP